MRLETRLFCTDRDVVLIPNLAIHFNWDVNKGYAFNRQTDLCPLFSAGKLQAGDFDAMVAGQLGIEPKNLLAKDLPSPTDREAVSGGRRENSFLSVAG